MLSLGFTLLGAGLGGIVSYFFFISNFNLVDKAESNSKAKQFKEHN